jgi:hypothetical protein
MEGTFQWYRPTERKPLGQRWRRYVYITLVWSLLILFLAFAASVWLNNVFLNTSFGK